MILYYTLTRYQQLASILHKMLFASEEEAHLYISNGNYVGDAYLERLKEAGIFAEVVVMNDQPAWAMGANVNFQHVENLYPALDRITELCYKSLLCPIEEYDDLYILADHFPMGFVLAYQKIPYHYFEEAVGVYCCLELWKKKILEQKNHFLYLVAQEVGVYGTSECVLDCWIDIDKQVEVCQCEKMIDFSVRKLLRELDNEKIEHIFSIFGIERVKNEDNDKASALILTEYLAGSKVCTWEEQRILYGQFIDYFCKDMRVYIKPHPNDHQGLYKKWFPQSVVIERSAPSELIPLCVEKKFNRILSLSSTSYISLLEDTEQVISYRSEDLRTEKMFRNLNIYYVISEILRTIDNEMKVYCIGADELQIGFFLKQAGIDGAEVIQIETCQIPLQKTRRVVIVDDLQYAEYVTRFDVQRMIRMAKENDIYIFLNSQKDVLFYEDEDNCWAEKTIPVMIREKFQSGVNSEKKESWIYIMTKDRKERRKLLLFQIDKMLENAGVEISVNSDEKSIRERVLEGMLEATEQKCILLSKRK